MHSHILFNVDDGPSTVDETMKMLEQAVKDGITAIISTSHAKHPNYDVSYEIVNQQIAQLQQEIINRNLPLKLYTGHEVRLTGNSRELYESRKIHTLANSNYLLLELPSSTVPMYTSEMIKSLVAVGITPIIAHPERNRAIAENPNRLELLVREGAVAQITAGSLAGLFGKKVQKTSLDLVRSNLVHTYGSDVHNLSTRPFLFNQGLHFLEKHKELDAVDYFLENNEKIIENQPFTLYEPQYISSKKWWRLFG